MKKRKQNKGLTLIELLVAMAAASILILTVTLILIMAFRSWRINNAFVDLRRDSAFAFSMMTRDVREAVYNDDLIDGNPLTFPSGAYTNLIVIKYEQIGNTLEYALEYDPDPDNKSGTMILIHDGVQSFTSTKEDAGDGVLLKLVLTGDFDIAITNEVFVNTRN